MTRKYLPTLADLIDRLSIDLMKRIFIGGTIFNGSCDALIHDIDLLLEKGRKLEAYDVYCILLIMLANRYIWENEGDIRTTPMTEGAPDGYKNIAKRLIATHSINGVRNTAKNVISARQNQRTDPKIDCLAADLPPEFGNWNVL